MANINNISDAGVYTDFNGLQKLRTRVSKQGGSSDSQQATREVARQFESLFLQMMLKSMRDANIAGDSQESDQTRFYQEMFDKQIALDLANNRNGGGLGISEMLGRDIGATVPGRPDESNAAERIEFIRTQIGMAGSVPAEKTTDNQE